MKRAVKSTEPIKKFLVAKFKRVFGADKVTTLQELDTVYRARLFKHVGNNQYEFIGQASLPKLEIIEVGNEF